MYVVEVEGSGGKKLLRRTFSVMMLSILAASILVSVLSFQPVLVFANNSLGVLTTVSARETKDWTFMVYLDADNNLESVGIEDFMEMSSVGSTVGINIVVQMDRISGHDTSYGDWMDCKRFYVTEGLTPTASNAVESLGEVNMGDPNTLEDFMVWAMQHYQAVNYIVVLWNHGSGWKTRANEHPYKGVCYDDTSGDSLSIHELESALGNVIDTTAEVIDVVGFDACLMGMIEVAYQLENCTDIMVASEEIEPGDGWPYDDILSDLVSSPTVAPSTLASRIVNYYVDSYQGGSQGTFDEATLSAFRPDQVVVTVAPAVSNFADRLNETLESYYNESLDAIYNTENFYYSEYLDLYDFAYEIKQRIPESNVQAAAQNVMDTILAVRVAEGHGPGHPDSHGLSIYLPLCEGSYNSNYESLDFATETSWVRFLHSLFTYSSDSDEYFYSTRYTPFDSDSDTYFDAVEVKVNVDTTGEPLNVTVISYLIDPNGTTVDSDNETWAIVGEGCEFGYVYLYMPSGGEEGWCDVELYLYDDDGSYEDYRYDSAVAYLPLLVETTVYVDPQLQEVGVGSAVTVKVNISEVENLAGFDIQMSWDTAFLEYVNHNVTMPVESYPGGILHEPVLMIKDEVNLTAGSYWIAAVSMSPDPPFNGSGIAFEMTFQAKTIGICLLDIFSCDLASYVGLPILHNLMDGLVEIVEAHDVAVTNISIPKTIVGQIFSTRINVTVENQGSFAETFNMTISVNETPINTTRISLVNYSIITVTVHWDTTGWPKNNYTISVTVDTVADEVDCADNNLVANEKVYVTIPGDVDADFDVDIFDVVSIVGSYGSSLRVRADPPYVPNHDINDDGKVDIFDIVIACNHYGESW